MFMTPADAAFFEGNNQTFKIHFYERDQKKG
jgi:hypothetical protein